MLSTFSCFSVFPFDEPSRFVLCLQKSVGSDGKPRPLPLHPPLFVFRGGKKQSARVQSARGSQRGICMCWCVRREIKQCSLC